MSLQTLITERKTTGRRGRPRKYPIAATKQENDDTNSPTNPISEEKPREERSYKDFFPDLDIKEPLNIVKIKKVDLSSSSDLVSIEQDQVKHSPSIDRYEITSEVECSIKPLYKLPIPSFQKLHQDSQDQTKPKKKKEEEKDNSIVFNNPSFQRPENHFIRYIEPSETELFETIEYDMDEQDEVWLQIYNKERKKENLGQVSSELFEAIIDQLEKEWFNLIKNLPKKTTSEPLLPEDSKCAVCDDGECENSNAIVFCDGCNLAVHQDCYGIPYIPEGQWLCRKCMVSPENPVSCLFCPFEGGAFKQTTTNQWGHLLCAIWIPEVGLSNSVYMEPIDNIESVPKSRWKLTCYICRRRQGACIQCDNKHCFIAFHVTCARWARLCMRMKLHGTHYDDVVLKAYCERHTPKDYKEQVDVDKTILNAQQWFSDSKHKNMMPHKRYVDEEEEEEFNVVDTSQKRDKKQRRQQAVTSLLPATKSARAHQHQYTAGAPIAPEYIIEKLESLPYVKQAAKLKKKSSMITSICRYWSLKRESRRGAPLLKRLHLEPWTASASQLKQSEVEKAYKASLMMNLRTDLDKVRMLSEQVQKRERQKLERIRKQKAYLEMILYPTEIVIQPVLEELIESDKKELFRYPVTLDLAPDYLDIIKHPMSFTDIFDKLAAHKYSTLDEFEYDLSLIWKNSMTYNKSETLYYKSAQRLEKLMNELMADARKTFETFQINTISGLLDVDINPDIFLYGDTESPKPSNDSINENSNVNNQKRRVDDKPNELIKKRRLTSPVEEVTNKKKTPTRITRSTTEKNKRTLRSRSVIMVDSKQPTKTKKPDTNTKKPKKTALPLKDHVQESSKLDTKEIEEGDYQLLDTTKVKFVDGEIIWARVPKFPSHPAKLYDPTKSNKDIPTNVLSLKPKENDDNVLVKFFLVGDAHTWGWVNKSYINPFGDLLIDKKMLTQAKKTRKPHRIKEVKTGYRHVCNLLNLNPEVAINEVFINKKK